MKITKLGWHLADAPYNFYKFYSEINGKHVHAAQIKRNFIDATGLTPAEGFAKLLRMTLDCIPEEGRKRTFE